MKSGRLHIAGAGLALTLALALVSPRGTSQAEVTGDTFVSGAPWHIQIKAPGSWRMSEQKSYTTTCLKAKIAVAGDESTQCQRSDGRYTQPSILLSMYRRSPRGKMLLAAERLDQPKSSRAYAEQTQALLDKLGLEVRTPQLHAATGAYWLEFNNGTAFVRQALLAAGGTGFSLTLSAPDARARSQHLRAFDYALRSIQVSRDTSPEVSPGEPADPSPPGDAPDAASPK